MANQYVLRARNKFKTDTLANYTTYNPQLLQGEVAFVKDKGYFKIGYSDDGTEENLKRFSELPAWNMYSDVDKAEVAKIAGLGTDIDTLKEFKSAYDEWKATVKNIATTGEAKDVTVDVTDLEELTTCKNLQEVIKIIMGLIGNAGSRSFTIKKEDEADEGYVSTYNLYLNGAKVSNSASINIPKDYLVKSANIKICQTADTPVSGYKKGDKYIDFIVNTTEGTGNESHIYLSVQELVDVYKGSNSIDVSATNEISIKLDTANTNGLEITADGLKLNLATDTTAGAMSAADHKKLAGVEEGANNYKHPTGAGNNHIPAGGSVGQVLVNSAAGEAEWKDAATEVTSSEAKNQVKINEDKTMEVNSLDVSKLVQESGDYIVFDCGGANGW